MKTPKQKTIITGFNKLTDNQVASILYNMTCAKIHALARTHGSPIKKYKDDTCRALAETINAPGRNCTVTATIKFI